MAYFWTSGGTIDCWEMDQTRSVSLQSGGSTGTVQLKCLQGDVEPLIEDIVGNNLPWPYPLPVSLYAISASVRPFPGETGTTNGEGIDYDHAIITVNYASVTKTDAETPVVYDEQTTPTAEFITLDYKKFQWTSDPDATWEDWLQEGEAPGKLVIGFDYVITLYNQVSVPAHVLTHPGSINNASVSSAGLGLTFPTGTLLYNPPVINRSIKLGTGNRYTIQFRFSYKKDGWNKFWRNSTGEFAQIYWNSGDPAPSYPSASFAGIVP